MRQHIRSCNVHMVGHCEGFAKGDLAAEILEIEGGAGVVDEDVEMAGVSGDGVEGGGDGVVACEIELEG